MRSLLHLKVRKVRKNKVEAGLALLNGPMTVKMNNLSSMECNMIRPFFLSALDRYHRHAKMERLGQPGGPAGESQVPSQQPQARQLRRGGV